MHPDSVVATAYQATCGRRNTLVAPCSQGPGCARCGTRARDMLPIEKVVSTRFTGYHSWANRRSAVLCPACSWAYRHPPLRTEIHLVSRRHRRMMQLTPAGLATVLAEPVTADSAIVIPESNGRKHVFPDAAWGRIAALGAQIAWGSREVEVLKAMARLRRLGFSSLSLKAATPPFRRLAALGPDRFEEVLVDWSELKQWRHAAPWWTVGLRATGPSAAQSGEANA